MTSALPSVLPYPARASLPLYDHKGWTSRAIEAFGESVGERAELKDGQEAMGEGRW